MLQQRFDAVSKKLVFGWPPQHRRGCQEDLDDRGVRGGAGPPIDGAPGIVDQMPLQCLGILDRASAIEQYRASVDIGRLPAGYRGLGLVYAQQGKLDEEMREIRKGLEVGPERRDFLADIAYVYALGGAKDSALVYLQRAKAQPIEGFNIARVDVVLGLPDSAFAWLDRSAWLQLL